MTSFKGNYRLKPVYSRITNNENLFSKVSVCACTPVCASAGGRGVRKSGTNGQWFYYLSIVLQFSNIFYMRKSKSTFGKLWVPSILFCFLLSNVICSGTSGKYATSVWLVQQICKNSNHLPSELFHTQTFPVDLKTALPPKFYFLMNN